MSATPTPPRPEDELLEQWSFLDSMVERQAEALRAGTQDVEEPEESPPLAASTPGELAQLRDRVAVLEREAAALRAQLEGRGRELQRAEQHSAELMRSLRDAHAAVEDSQRAALAAERRAAEAEAAAATAAAATPAAAPQAPATGEVAAPPTQWSERPRRSAIFANQDPPPPPAKPSLLDRLLGRR